MKSMTMFRLSGMLSDIAGMELLDYFGVADISMKSDEVTKQGGALVAGYPRAISFGIAIPRSVTDALLLRDGYDTRLTYQNQGYDVLNARLDRVTSLVSQAVTRVGFRALPVPAAERIDSEMIAGSFSHKLAAGLCGFGWIGKNGLLVTERYGPRVRWGSVLTDAPLASASKMVSSRCGGCSVCAAACPVGAIKGVPFIEGMDRDELINVHTCDGYFNAMKERGELPVCGRCLISCVMGHGNE
jgi:epoxyqueuosine reductase